MTTTTEGTWRVTCVLPVHDEQEVIRRVVERTAAALASFCSGFEIVAVDDGSSDDSGAILAAIGEPWLRVIHFPANLGYGRALRAGFEAASHPLVCFMDSDDQFDPLDFANLLPLIADADLVVGFRDGRCDGWLRGLLSAGYNELVRAALGLAVRDVNCAFKLIRRDALAGLELTSDSYAINAELLARAARADLRVREAPVRHFARKTGRSKVGVGDIPGALVRVAALRHRLRSSESAGVVPQERDGARART